MNWLFLAVVIFIFIMGVYGYVKGLLRMLYTVVSLIIAIIAMIIFAPFLSSLMQSNDTLMGAIEAPIIETIGEKLDDGVDVKGALQDYYHLPESVSGKINEMLSGSVDDAKINITESIARTIAEYLCDIISYIIVFFTVRLLTVVIGSLLHIVEKFPVINTMNHLGGTTLALLEALVCVWLFFLIIDLIHASQLGLILIKMVLENDFLRMLYQNNMLTYFLS